MLGRDFGSVDLIEIHGTLLLACIDMIQVRRIVIK